MAPALAVLKSKKHWEALARMDPCWAIFADPRKKFRGWDLDEFFLTGAQEISRLMEVALQLGYPRTNNLALDFGCGVGRLTGALSKHFEKCVGVDISEEMIRRATELNRDLRNCEFILNVSGALEQFSQNSFDLIYTSVVLQHIPTKAGIMRYVADFIRTLKPGGLLVMQLPCFIPWRLRVQPRRRLYELLRCLGFRESFLYERLRLDPVRMTFVSEKEILSFLNDLGATTLRVQRDSMAGPRIESRTYFVARSVL